MIVPRHIITPCLRVTGDVNTTLVVNLSLFPQPTHTQSRSEKSIVCEGSVIVCAICWNLMVASYGPCEASVRTYVCPGAVQISENRTIAVNS